jgi:hypothetical protein
MADNILRSEYSILLTRKGSECVASIPELCIAEKGTTPQEALSAALRVETEIRETIEGKGMPLPPASDRIDPFPGVTRLARRHFPFLAKIAIGYVLVVCMTAVSLALVFPSVRSRAEPYLTSKDLATDVRKVLSRFGVTLCLEDR